MCAEKSVRIGEAAERSAVVVVPPDVAAPGASPPFSMHGMAAIHWNDEESPAIATAIKRAETAAEAGSGGMYSGKVGAAATIDTASAGVHSVGARILQRPRRSLRLWRSGARTSRRGAPPKTVATSSSIRRPGCTCRVGEVWKSVCGRHRAGCRRRFSSRARASLGQLVAKNTEMNARVFHEMICLFIINKEIKMHSFNQLPSMPGWLFERPGQSHKILFCVVSCCELL